MKDSANRKASLREKLEHHVPTLYQALRVIGRGRFEIFPPRAIFASGSLHEKLKSRFAGGPGIFFEVGANNGIEASNTAYLEKYCDWRGILVEATPHKYVECVRNRPNSVVVHAALTPFDYCERYVEILYSNLMSVTRLSEISIESHIAMGSEFLAGETALSGSVFLAPARTTDSILAENGYPMIDLFSLDVEGAELQVLKGIDFSKSRPRNFVIEARDPDVIGHFLQDKGYGMTEKLSHHDYLFSDIASPDRATAR